MLAQAEAENEFNMEDDDRWQVIQIDGEKVKICGYVKSSIWTAIIWFLMFATGGILALMMYWYPVLYLKATHDKCTLQKATRIYAVQVLPNRTRREFIEDVKTMDADCARKETERKASNGDRSANIVNKQEWTDAYVLTYHRGAGRFKDCVEVTYVEILRVRFLWDNCQKKFVELKGLESKTDLKTLAAASPIGEVERWKRLMLFGSNMIEVPRESCLKLLVHEMVQPFYVFQTWSFILWSGTEYYYFASIVIILTATCLGLSIWETRRVQEKLIATICSDPEITLIHPTNGVATDYSTRVVPGDIIVITSDMTASCDAVLIHGIAMVNESMVTGESVSVMKTAVSARAHVGYNEQIHSEHTVYGGTKVVQAKSPDGEPVTAVVLRTGYATKKGRLVSSILNPLPKENIFERDSIRFILLLAGVAVVGMFINLARSLEFGETGFTLFLSTADITTIIVPPALPAAIAIGTYTACRRLRKKSIFCMRQRTINVGGSVDLVCFDKTGTLTEDSMTFHGLAEVNQEVLVFSEDIEYTKDPSERPGRFREGMAVCHSLVKVDNDLEGDSQELQIYRASKYSYEDATEPQYIAEAKPCEPAQSDRRHDVGILRIFPFSSEAKRSSVVSQIIGSEVYDFYCKGSPETVLSLCNPATVPRDVFKQLKQFTQKGLRVIAMAHKEYVLENISEVERSDLEADLSFLGALILKNPLRQDSSHVIDSLHKANIRTVMITGDSLETGLAIGREAHLIRRDDLVLQIKTIYEEDINRSVPCFIPYESEDKSESKDCVVDIVSERRHHLVVEGGTIAVLKESYPDEYWKVLLSTTVFARTSPGDKEQIVNDLYTIGYRTCMVGDGANDCGALKAAQIGIALTETEASVAAPFTCTKHSVACVLDVIAECRCSLVTAFSEFQFIAVCSLIQFVSVMILRDCGAALSDLQFLFIDLIVTATSCFFGFTPPYDGSLYPVPPSESLMSFKPILSILIQAGISSACQIGAVQLLRNQPWFVPHNELSNSPIKSDEVSSVAYETVAIFLTTIFMYLVLPITYSKGAPYRKIFLANLPMVITITLFGSAALYLSLCTGESVTQAMELRIPIEGWHFQAKLVGIAIAFALTSLTAEWFISSDRVTSLCNKARNMVLEPRMKYYEEILEQLTQDITWEPNHHKSEYQMRK